MSEGTLLEPWKWIGEQRQNLNPVYKSQTQNGQMAGATANLLNALPHAVHSLHIWVLNSADTNIIYKLGVFCHMSKDTEQDRRP